MRNLISDFPAGETESKRKGKIETQAKYNKITRDT